MRKAIVYCHDIEAGLLEEVNSWQRLYLHIRQAVYDG